MSYKNISFFVFLLCTSLICSRTTNATTPPARIGGTITVDGTMLTQATSTGYSIIVTRQDLSSYQPTAECNSLNSLNWYLIDLPMYHVTLNPEGANPGDTAKILLYHNGVALNIVSPDQAQLIVGNSGSATQIDLTATTIQTIETGPAAGSSLFPSNGFFSTPPKNVTVTDTSPANFPFGIFDFTVSGLSNGEEISVTFTTPTAIPKNCLYYKYQNGNFFEYNRVSGLDDGDNTFMVTIKDGELGDDDYLVNGHISDPGGPGIPISTIKAYSIPALSGWGIFIFILILTTIGPRKIQQFRNKTNLKKY